MALTARRQAFINEYLTCWNASESARRAGYSELTAGAIGSDLLKNIEVSDEIKRRVAEMTMTADEVLVRLADQARGDMADYVSFVPGVKAPFIDLAKANETGKLRNVKKVKYTEQGGIEFELYDAQAALALLAKYHKLLTDRSEISGRDGGPIEYADVTELTDEELARIATHGSASGSRTISTQAGEA